MPSSIRRARVGVGRSVEEEVPFGRGHDLLVPEDLDGRGQAAGPRGRIDGSLGENGGGGLGADPTGGWGKPVPRKPTFETSA